MSLLIDPVPRDASGDVDFDALQKAVAEKLAAMTPEQRAKWEREQARFKAKMQSSVMRVTDRNPTDR